MEGVKTIKTDTGELYAQGDVIVGRMEVKGNVTKYYKENKLHRDGDLPASIWRNKDGVVTLEVYCRDGKYHRDGDLPAYIERNDAGVVTQEWYYRDGNYISKEETIKAKKEKEAADVVEKLTRELAEANARTDAAVAELAALKAKIKAAFE